MRLNSKQIAAYTGGEFVVEPIDPSEIISGVSWDSREMQEGWLYIALPGERVDGHDFIASALRSGARCVLVTEKPDEATLLLAREMGAAVIGVPNTYSAVTDLAREWRGHLKGRVIGLTGSTGKTTTKNLVRDVVAASRSVVATKANQNNELGVPRTLLNADPETEVVVVEMGMRGLGQISSLCAFARPDWGVVTNVGESHIELLGSRENIARAKSELIEALPAGTGCAFLNADDEYSAFVAARGAFADRGVTCVAYGPAAGADRAASRVSARPRLWAEDVSLDDEGRPRFTLCASGFDVARGIEPACDRAVERCACHLALRGLHNVSNACAAAAVGCMLGMKLDDIARALASSLPESGRQEIIRSRGGYLLVNDAYNANPDSMRASLSMFCALAVEGKRYAVLGDMGELGDYAYACHRGVGKVVAGLPVDCLICVGELSRFIAEGASSNGMKEQDIISVDTVADVIEVLDARLEPGDAVLVKASHAMGLNRVVEGLVS